MSDNESNTTSQSAGIAFWQALRIFLADVGTSAILGFVAGLFFGAARFSIEEAANNPFFPILGLIVSVYAAYALNKRYSQETAAIISLMLIGAFWGALSIFVGSRSGGEFNLTKQAIILMAQMLSYFFGWYLARQTSLRVYIPPNAAFITVAVIGGIGIMVSGTISGMDNGVRYH